MIESKYFVSQSLYITESYESTLDGIECLILYHVYLIIQFRKKNIKSGPKTINYLYIYLF